MSSLSTKDAEKQHIHEHETLQILQQHALNGNEKSFFDLLMKINGEDKRRDIMELCDMSSEQLKNYQRDRYNEISFYEVGDNEISFLETHGNNLSKEKNLY